MEDQLKQQTGLVIAQVSSTGIEDHDQGQLEEEFICLKYPEGLGGVVSQEEVRYCRGWALRIGSLVPFPVCFLFLACGLKA